MQKQHLRKELGDIILDETSRAKGINIEPLNNKFQIARAEWFINPNTKNMLKLIKQAKTSNGKVNIIKTLKTMYMLDYPKPNVSFKKWLNTPKKIYRKGNINGYRSWSFDYQTAKTAFKNKGKFNKAYVKPKDILVFIAFESEAIINSSDLIR